MDTINVGSNLDTGVVFWIDNDSNHSFMNLSDLTEGKRIVLFGGPAPYSRLDTVQALDYARLSKEMMEHVNMVYGIYLQDAFVCKEFQKMLRAETDTNILVILGDGDGDVAKKYQLTQDLTNHGLGLRSIRWCAVVNNGVVEYFAQEENGKVDATSAGKLLNYLKG